MEKFKKQFLITVYLLLVANIVFAQGGGLVPCNGPDCTLCDFLQLINNVINFLIKVGLALTGALVAWGAFVIMTSGAQGVVEGKADKGGGGLTRGKEILTTAIKGAVIMLVAWLLIGTVLQVFSGSPNKFPWNKIQCSSTK